MSYQVLRLKTFVSMAMVWNTYFNFTCEPTFNRLKNEDRLCNQDRGLFY